MLKELLDPETCADCRLCCVFDSYDLRETPVFDTPMRDRIRALCPDAAFVQKGAFWQFRVTETDAEGCFPCPALDPDSGCRLGGDKPFLCRLFPFRIMEHGGRHLIAVSPYCQAMAQHSLGTLLRFLKGGVAETVFTYAAAHPDVVQPYDEAYPILLWEPQTFD
jgi:hypothetical protein